MRFGKRSKNLESNLIKKMLDKKREKAQKLSPFHLTQKLAVVFIIIKTNENKSALIFNCRLRASVSHRRFSFFPRRRFFS